MAETLNMPKFGMTMESGKVEKWCVDEGESFDKGAVVLEVETDKAVVEVEAEREGTLLKILVAPGTTVDCGTPLAWIGESCESPPD